MKNLKDIAYDAIKHKILTCQYPPDTFLNEAEICKEVNASRTPVREAMSRLELEGLIKIFPKRGALVSNISFSEINEIYQVRILVEPHIILTSARNIEPSKIVSIKKRLEEDANQTVIVEDYQTDKDIHNLILKSSNNRYFLSLMDNIFDQNHRLRILSGQRVQKRLEHTTQEHLTIVNALLDHDWQKAAEAMAIHLDNSKEAAIDGMKSYSGGNFDR